MKPSILIGAASAIVKSKRLKIVFVALQLGYLAHRYLEDKRKNKAELTQ